MTSSLRDGSKVAGVSPGSGSPAAWLLRGGGGDGGLAVVPEPAGGGCPPNWSPPLPGGPRPALISWGEAIGGSEKERGGALIPGVGKKGSGPRGGRGGGEKEWASWLRL